MRYVYIGVSDLYLPTAAAAIHLGQLNRASAPAKEQLRKLSYFRTVSKEDDGKLFLVGEDKNGDEVYIASVKGHPDVVARAVQSLLGLYQISLKEVQVIPCIPDNPQISAVCSLFKRLGLKGLADYLGYRLVNNRFGEILKSIRVEPV